RGGVAPGNHAEMEDVLGLVERGGVRLVDLVSERRERARRSVDCVHNVCVQGGEIRRRAPHHADPQRAGVGGRFLLVRPCRRGRGGCCAARRTAWTAPRGGHEGCGRAGARERGGWAGGRPAARLRGGRGPGGGRDGGGDDRGGGGGRG